MAILTDVTKRLIGQHFVVGFDGLNVEDGSEIVDLIRNYHVGSVILMIRSVQSITQVHALLQKLQRIARDAGHERPLLVGIDQENGLVARFSSTSKEDMGTQFPGAMSLAATSQPELAEQVSAATGKEMRMAGINWCYSPVADINSNPLNPVIGVRSFSDDPETVRTFSLYVASGLYSSKVAPCAKHFPGHGDTDTDSHLSLPVIHKDLASMQSTELAPFTALVRERVPSIMTAHIALPSIIGDNTPASLSRKVTTDILRGDLGFKGVVVTDCLEMEAVAATYGTERAALMALQAGADIAMICHTYSRQVGAIKTVYEAFEAGTITLEGLVDSTERIRDFKDAFTGTWDEVTGGTLDNERLAALLQVNAKLSAEVYAASTSWLIPDRKFSPISSQASVVAFVPQVQSINPAVDDPDMVQPTGNAARKQSTLEGYRAFVAAVSSRAKKCEHFVYNPEDAQLQQLQDDVLHALSASDKVIFVTRNADHASWQLSYLRKLISTVSPPDRIVLVASCGPYGLSCAAGKGIDLACLCTFEFTKPAMESAARVIFGEGEAVGHVPVKVDY